MEESRNYLVLIILLVAILPTVMAAGVVRPYWDGYPLQMLPGETTIINLTLQNVAGNTDLSFSVELVEDGGGIASLVEGNKIYDVPLGRSDIKVPIKISAPRDIPEGEIRNVVINFKQISSSGAGTVPVAGSFNTNFPVQIVEEKKTEKPKIPIQEGSGATKIIFIIFGGIILLGILIVAIFFGIRKLKKRREISRIETRYDLYTGN